MYIGYGPDPNGAHTERVAYVSAGYDWMSEHGRDPSGQIFNALRDAGLMWHPPTGHPAGHRLVTRLNRPHPPTRGETP